VSTPVQIKLIYKGERPRPAVYRLSLEKNQARFDAWRQPGFIIIDGGSVGRLRPHRGSLYRLDETGSAFLFFNSFENYPQATGLFVRVLDTFGVGGDNDYLGRIPRWTNVNWPWFTWLSKFRVCNVTVTVIDRPSEVIELLSEMEAS
jgi:hypothetical protein